MKKQIFNLVLFFIFTLNISQAQQHASDTFRIKPFPFKMWYGPTRIKKPSQAEPYLFRIHDETIKRDWQTAKTWRNVGLGVEILGLGVETAGFLKTLNGDGDPQNLVLKGVGIMLGGAIVQLIGMRPMKRAVYRYNDLKNGRFQPRVDPPIPAVYKDSSIAPLPLSEPVKMSPVAKKQSPSRAGAAFWGIGAGIGWSKQKLNYEEAFDKLEKASVNTFNLQYGRQMSESFGWQIELGFTQHGLREVTTDYAEGIETKVKSDLLMRYLELPFMLNLKLPLGTEAFRLEAMAGASAGLLQSAKIVSRATGEEDKVRLRLTLSAPVDLSDVETKDKLDMAIQAGLRASGEIGGGRVFLEGRYHYGVLNLERNSGNVFEDPESYNRSFLVRLGYQMVLN